MGYLYLLFTLDCDVLLTGVWGCGMQTAAGACGHRRNSELKMAYFNYVIVELFFKWAIYLGGKYLRK